MQKLISINKLAFICLGFLASSLVMAQPVATQESSSPVPRGEPLDELLIDQAANCDTFGSTSQFFTDFSGGSDLADDFTVPANTEWVINTVNAPGFYSANAANTTSTVNVRFWDDSGASGFPGNLVCEAAGVTVASGDTDGNYVVDLSADPCVLGEGNYWFSVQAVLAFNGTDQWFWFNAFDNNGSGRVFQDVDDLFGTGCTTWDLGDNCIAPNAAGANDQCFALAGTSGVVLPESQPVSVNSPWAMALLILVLAGLGVVAVRRFA